MYQFRPLISAIAILSLSACNLGSSESGDGGAAAQIALQEQTSSLANGTFGHVRYRYDTDKLTRADTELPLPPDFTESVFAVKFIPSELIENIGSEGCSFTSGAADETCTAGRAMGFAISLLPRPVEHYRNGLDTGDERVSELEQIEVNGVTGITLLWTMDDATSRYTFLPTEGRTLLLVDRNTVGAQVASEALREVKDSIAF